MKDEERKRHSSAIDARHEGMTLVDYLAARFTYFPRESWRSEIGSGRVTRNEKACDGSERLARGDVVAYSPPERTEPPVEVDYDIVFEDDDFLMINKPPNLPCHPAGIYRANTLLALLRERYSELRLVNRLDRETSGVVVGAKSREAAARAGNAFARGTVDKEYLALVEGHFPERLEARGWLGPDEASPVRKKLVFSPERGAIACETVLYRVGLHVFDDGSEGSLVRAVPITGRTHQIRATLCSLGFPVVGDKLYGRDDGIFLRFIAGALTERDTQTLRMGHHALHCFRMAFSLDDGIRREAEAPVPTSWPSDSSPLMAPSYRPAGGLDAR